MREDRQAVFPHFLYL